MIDYGWSGRIRNILSIRTPIVMAFLDHIFVVWKVTFFKDTTHPSVEYSTHFLWLHKMDFYIFYGSNLKLSIPEISVAISDENKTFSWTSCNQDYSCLSLHHSSQSIPLNFTRMPPGPRPHPWRHEGPLLAELLSTERGHGMRVCNQLETRLGLLNVLNRPFKCLNRPFKCLNHLNV